MTEQNGVTVRAVKWWDVCPWLTILRIFRLSYSLRLLVFGAVGILLTLLGWWFLTWLFLDTPGPDAWWTGPLVASSNPFEAIDNAVPDRPLERSTELVRGPASQLASGRPIDPFFGVWAQLSQPVWRILIEREMSPADLACMILSALWALGVWAFLGGAISRIAAVQLASDERVGWGSALRYAGSKWLSYFAAPLFPLFGILLIVVPLFLVGLIMRWGVGLLLVSLAWPLLLVGGFIMALLLLGLVFGWPLMWATISAEGTDTFDALSRSYAYTFQRPLRYLFYAIVAAILGFLGWLLVSNFAAAIVWLTFWATSWGSGTDGMLALQESTAGQMGGSTGMAIVRFWAGCVKWLALGYVYGYFWTASTAIYFLLRRDVDATEMDEVFLEADETEGNFGLPPLETAAGEGNGEAKPEPQPATAVAGSAE
jgi:hypothetical protein